MTKKSIKRSSYRILSWGSILLMLMVLLCCNSPLSPTTQHTNLMDKNSNKMHHGIEKIDKDFYKKISSYKDTSIINCLMYPSSTLQELEAVLNKKKQDYLIEYNSLRLANCIAVQIKKSTLLKLVGEPVVAKVLENKSTKIN